MMHSGAVSSVGRATLLHREGQRFESSTAHQFVHDMEIASQVIGWAGTLLIVAAYFLVSTKKVDAQSTVYQALNLLGALAVGVNVFHQQAWPAFTLQVIWGIIALTSLARAGR